MMRDDFNRAEVVRLGAIVRGALTQHPALGDEALAWLARTTDERLGEVVIEGVASVVDTFQAAVVALVEG